MCGKKKVQLTIALCFDAFRLAFRKATLLSKVCESKAYYQQGEAGNKLICELLNSNQPFLVGRLGYVESAIAGVALTMREIRVGRFIFDRIKYKMYVNEYFWPRDDDMLLKQGHLCLDALPDFDLYICWNTFLEKYFSRFLTSPSAMCADFSSLEPFCFDQPWSSALKDKKVLVICPFPETVKRQYAKRALIWADKEVLPDFELHTLKAIYGRSSAPDSPSWFDALDAMFQDAMQIEFDVALLACGPFAVPLGHRFKQAGRSAITMCGVTQILFGIKGRRWDDRPYISKFYNSAWCRPDPKELPEFVKSVEKGCYI